MVMVIETIVKKGVYLNENVWHGCPKNYHGN